MDIVYVLDMIAKCLGLVVIVANLGLLAYLTYACSSSLREIIRNWSKPHVDQKFGIVLYPTWKTKIHKALMVLANFGFISFCLFCVFIFIFVLISC